MPQPLSRKVALELAQHVGHRVADEGPEVGVIAVNGLDQAQVGHLLEVVLGLARVPVAAGQALGQRHRPLDQLLTCAEVAVAVATDQQLL
jgi:hypothetical protein